MTAAPQAAALTLTDSMKKLVNNALNTGKPITVAYVDELSQPHLSFRGTVQTFSDEQLALWVRNPVGGIAAAIGNNPSVVLLYGDLNPENRAFLTFRGRGRV